MHESKVLQVFKTLELLSRPQGVTLDELMGKLNASRKTANRMLNTIQEMHFPIYPEKDPQDGRRKRWKFIDTYQKQLPNMTVPEINLSVPELVALYLLKGEERLFKGSEVEKKIDSAFSKISRFIPPDVPIQLNKLRPLFLATHKFTKDYSNKGKIIEGLTEAILESKTCNIEYYSFVDDKLKSFLISPLHLFENQGGLYLFVNATDYDDIRILAAERIRKLRITSKKFVYPKKFDPEQRMEATFDISMDDEKKYKIWFASSQAKYIKERKWSPNQKINNQKDGSIVLTMTTSGMYDVMRWVMQYGSDAEVLEPKELRQDMIEDIFLMQRRYGLV